MTPPRFRSRAPRLAIDCAAVCTGAAIAFALNAAPIAAITAGLIAVVLMLSAIIHLIAMGEPR